MIGARRQCKHGTHIRLTTRRDAQRAWRRNFRRGERRQRPGDQIHPLGIKHDRFAAGFDPDKLPQSDPSKMNFGSGGNTAAKAWKDIWGCGQGIGAIHEVVSAGERVAQLANDYEQAQRELAAKTALFGPRTR